MPVAPKAGQSAHRVFPEVSWLVMLSEASSLCSCKPPKQEEVSVADSMPLSLPQRVTWPLDPGLGDAYQYSRRIRVFGESANDCGMYQLRTSLESRER